MTDQADSKERMMAKITEPTVVDKVTAIQCDRCGKQFKKGAPEFGATTSINHQCGYGSVWKDGDQIAADICERCLKELIDPFCRKNLIDQVRHSQAFEEPLLPDKELELTSKPGLAKGMFADAQAKTQQADETSRDSVLEARHPGSYKGEIQSQGAELDWDSFLTHRRHLKASWLSEPVSYQMDQRPKKLKRFWMPFGALLLRTATIQIQLMIQYVFGIVKHLTVSIRLGAP
ncbi:MAG: hypothetical protein V7677_17625 [Motiliproteus sp.]